MELKKGDHISFCKGSDTWKEYPSSVWEVEYVSPGCEDLNCHHDDCWREPFVSVRPIIYHGFPLADVETVFDANHHGHPFKAE